MKKPWARNERQGAPVARAVRRRTPASSDRMERGNLWRAIPRRARAEVMRVLVQAAGVRIERIVSTGQASPPDFWYDQVEHEWVLLLSGRARLRIAGRRRVLALKPGDHVLLPAHTRHRVDWTDPAAPTVWLAVFWRP